MSKETRPWDDSRQPVKSGSQIVLPSQRRSVVRFKNLALRDNTETGGKTLAGHAAVFDQLSEVLCGFIGGPDSWQFGYFREKIARGAFLPVLEDDVRQTIDHEGGVTLLGRTVSGTLRLYEDPRGLAFECDLPDTQASRDAQELVSRGDLSQCSFMFGEPVASESWDFSNEDATDADGDDDENPPIRTIQKFSTLYDVSLVTYPAYPQTDALLREALTTGASARTVTRSLPSRAVKTEATEQDAAEGTEREGVEAETVEAPEPAVESTDETSQDLPPDEAQEPSPTEDSEESRPEEDPQSEAPDEGDVPDEERSTAGAAEDDRLGAHAVQRAKDLRLAKAKRVRAAADE